MILNVELKAVFLWAKTLGKKEYLSAGRCAGESSGKGLR